MIVKILGGLDLTGAIIFLMLAFGLSPFFSFTLFCGGLILLKGFFLFTGEIVLSGIDLLSGALLIISAIISLPIILIWTFAFLLIAKGVVSFL